MASGWITRKGKTDRKTGAYVAGRLDIYARDNMECCYCGKECKPATLPGFTREAQVEYMRANYADFCTLDHITSQWAIAQVTDSAVDFKKAIRDPKNLVTVCNACNSSKKHTELYIWAVNRGLDYSAIMARIAHRTSIVIVAAV